MKAQRPFRSIWNAFLETEEEEFKKTMGYGRRTIKRMGIKKFILANDWSIPEDVTKWRSDAIHVVVCPHCKVEFGLLNDDLGLCDECIKRIDLDKFYNDLRAHAKTEEQTKWALARFMTDAKLRSQYYKKSKGLVH